MKLTVLLMLGVVVCGACSAQPDLQHNFYPGYRAIHYVDSSRTYKPGTDEKHILHYRPIDVDVWYPAVQNAPPAFVRYGDLLKNYKERGSFYTEMWLPGFDSSFAGYLTTFFGGTDSIALLNYSTGTIKDAPFPVGKHPAIVYLSSYNGMAHENVFLLEELARKGFVVVSIASNGRFPGEMTMQVADLMEQVLDAKFALSRLMKSGNIDTARIGAIGYSWGGPAAAILSMDPMNRVKAVVSLDGSEMHAYGNVPVDDSLWNAVRLAKLSSVQKLKMPYLYLASDRSGAKTDSVSYIPHAEYVQIDSAKHTDFACYPCLVKPDSYNCTVHKTAVQIAVDFMCGRLAKKQITPKITTKRREHTGIKRGFPYKAKKVW